MLLSKNGWFLLAAELATVALFAYDFYDCKDEVINKLMNILTKDKVKKKKPLKVKGLINMKNQCFANAVLQALASCFQFKNFLDNLVKSKKIITSNCLDNAFNNYNAQEKNNVSFQKRSFFSLLFGRKRIRFNSHSRDQNGLNYCSLNTCIMFNHHSKFTKMLIKILDSLNGQNRVKKFNHAAFYVNNYLQPHSGFKEEEEQDAHELLNVLISALEMETYSIISFSVNEKSLENMKKNLYLPIINGQMKFRLPSSGLLASFLDCPICGYKFTVKLDQFHTVVLPLSTKSSPITIQECLRSFISPETLMSVNCENCKKTLSINSQKNTSVFFKRLMFARLPNLLILQLQRLTWLRDGRLTKNLQPTLNCMRLSMDEFVYSPLRHKRTPFPFKLIGGNKSFRKTDIEMPSLSSGDDLAVRSINGLTERTTPKHLYNLTAVIQHLGSAFNGHYVCYRKLKINDKDCWFFISDDCVRQVTESEVHIVPSYMLFYEREKLAST